MNEWSRGRRMSTKLIQTSLRLPVPKQTQRRPVPSAARSPIKETL